MLWLFFTMLRWMQVINGVDGTLHELNENMHALRREHHWTLDEVAGVVAAEGKRTRERIAQIKTRLADEERDDQQTKRQARQ